MNTFLPWPDFEKSAKALDRQRLGKQRVETLQLLRGSWPHHPASKMWVGYFYQLGNYGIAICTEWITRGYKDTCLDKIRTEQARFDDTGLPPWFGDSAFHLAHQSNLIRKMPTHYEQLFSGVPNNLPYIWPVRSTKN